MIVAQLRQATKSECGIAQPYSCIAGDNILKEQYARTTASNLALTNLKPRKLDTEGKKERCRG